MQQCLILAQSEASASSLELWRTLYGHDELSAKEDVVEAIVVSNLHPSDICLLALYETLVCRIEGAISLCAERQCSEIVALVDSIVPEKLTAVSERSTWENLVAMLVLTFPEIRWLFGVLDQIHASRTDAPQFPHAEHGLISCAALTAGTAIFDPSGIREWIRWRTNVDLVRLSDDPRNPYAPFQLPQRKELAAVIEDEIDYALMHGYSAYRFGFRTEIVNSWTQMHERFHVRLPRDNEVTPERMPIPQKHNYRLILEDMRLQFADKPANIHLSRLQQRGVNCNRLADENDNSDFRYMISTGQESGSDDLWALNEGFLYNKRIGYGKLLPKPIGGPFELWRATGLRKLLEGGKADGFFSPPSESLDELYSGHGAPGKIALIAGKLIERARRVASVANSPSGFILSAVLANDAFELLGGKTPTMSLEALKIKHLAEVRAECTFVGAGFHFDLNDRFAEIYEFVHSTCRWYHQSVRKYAELDARATICNELVKVYSEAGQAEERDACLAEFRWNNRRLELLQALEKRRPVSFCANCILLYAELLLVSMTRIVAAFVLWIALFWLVTHFAVDQTNDQGFAVLLATQLDWMVGGGASGIDELSKATEGDERRLAWISIAANVIGVFHFGILMSFLYALISRK